MYPPLIAETYPNGVIQKTENPSLAFGYYDIFFYFFIGGADTGLTPEELAMLEKAEKHPFDYDEDSPKPTPEQLAQFRPVYFATMEKRAQAMKQGVAILGSV